MGIFDALNTSVGGLQAQSFALQNISGNIANASTTGYKGISTSFEDLVPAAAAADRQAAGGVTAHSQATITTKGTVSASTVSTNMAIVGDGFFNVQKPIGITDNVPVFDGVTNYTRRGDFQLNANGNLVNGAGYFLLGVAVDPRTGNPTGNVPQVLQFQNNFIPAQATTSISYAANLPTRPSTVASTTAAAGTLKSFGGLDPFDFSATANPRIVGTPGAYADTTLTGGSATNKMASAITNNTKLSGAAGTDSIGTSFAAGDTLVVNGTTITFVASGATGNQLNITDSIGTMLAKIDSITGATGSTVNSPGGTVTLHTGVNADLAISGSANAVAALGSMGVTTLTQARTVGAVGSGVVIGNDLAAFTAQSISGGAVTAYDATGTPVNLQLRWAKVDSSSLGGTHSDTWNLFYQTNTAASGTQTAWVNAGTDFRFSSSGALISPSGSTITLPGVAVDSQTLGSVTFNFGSGGLTQYASTGGTATINQISQNGYAAGQLQSVAVNNSGLVVGTFSNGQNLNLAAVSLSHFNGTNYLKALDGGAYAATDESGVAIAGATGSISGSALEGSNTDIADEFTKLIVTQQAYSANTKVITTANSMVQDLLNVLR